MDRFLPQKALADDEVRFEKRGFGTVAIVAGCSYL